MIIEIKNYPGYKITDTGVIYNKNGLALKYHHRKSLKKSGHPHKPYPRVCLYYKNKHKWFTVHRLVALHFVPNPDNLPIVHHKDNNPRNPKASNLEWITHKDNTQNAIKDGRIDLEKRKGKGKKFGNHPWARPVVITHKRTKETLEFDSIRRLQEFLKLKYTCSIHQAIREPNRTVRGYYIKGLDKRKN